MTKSVVPSYFDFVKGWLAERPRRTAKKRTAGSPQTVRFVPPELAVFTRRRIRSGCHDWQPLRWYARHKRTDAVHRVHPAFDPKGIQGLIGKNHRLTIAHTHGDRLRLRATLKFLEARVDDTFLSPRCYGSRPQGRRKCTDRGAALRRFRQLVWQDGHRWVAKLDVKKFYDRVPHGRVLAALAAAVPDKGCYREIEGYLAWYWRQTWPGHAAPRRRPRGLPQGSPVSGVLANIFMTSFDKALTKAGIEHIRFIDDITLMARSPDELAAHIKRAMRLILWLGLHLSPAKTQVAYLGPDKPSQATLVVPGALALLQLHQELPVHQEIDVLGVHFYGDGRFRARERTVRRLLSKVRRIIEGKGDPRPPLARYITATATINRMLGYQVGSRRPGTKAGAKTKPGPPPPRTPKRVRRARSRSSPHSATVMRIPLRFYFTGRVWISGMRFVQPRQHALLGHSPLVAAQMHRVDELIGRWMKRTFDGAIAAANLPAGLLATLRRRRVRSALKMYEMASREPPPPCPASRIP